MGCQTCNGKAAAAAQQYPYDARMPDGSRVTVTSAADERVQRERFAQKEREAARTSGYTVRR